MSDETIEGIWEYQGSSEHMLIFALAYLVPEEPQE
jgi:hypothetical protein